MRTVLEKNIENPIGSITVLDLKEPFFDPNWHFHPHYQLFTVLEGEGTRLIGDSTKHFEKGDTVLLGPNLPHLWRNEKDYFEPDSELGTHGIVVYFTQEMMDNLILSIPESHQIKRLLQESHRGLEFFESSQKLIQESLCEMRDLKGFDSILYFLNLLNELSKNEHSNFISSLSYTNTHRKSETERMHKVYEYAIKHFKEEIKLLDVANLANMTIPSFCRYFKKRSNKTFSVFISEMRIGHACKLLNNPEQNIAQIAFESGFNSISNFNKAFKEVVGKTPRAYRLEIKE